MACPTPRMLVNRTQWVVLSAINESKSTMASKTRVHRASFCRGGELPSTGRRRRWWCHDHVRSQRRSVGMASSLPMLTTTCASIAAARSRVWAHTTTCCDTSFDVAQQHVQRSETGRVATVSECGGPVRIIYQPSVTRHALVQARNGVRSIGPISTRIAVQPPSCRWCPRRGMAATHGQPWCQ